MKYQDTIRRAAPKYVIKKAFWEVICVCDSVLKRRERERARKSLGDTKQQNNFWFLTKIYTFVNMYVCIYTIAFIFLIKNKINK